MIRLAARNLARNVRRTLLTGAAIAFGLGMMILATNLQHGQFKAIIAKGTSSLAGHVVVEPLADDEATLQLLDGAAERAEALRARVPGAVVTTRLDFGGLLTSPTNSVGVSVRAADPVAEAAVDDLPRRVIEGGWLDPADDRAVLLGDALARALGVALGDKVVLMVSDGPEVRSELLRVRGIFRTGSAPLDGFHIRTNLAVGQRVVGAPDSATQLALHLQDPGRSEAVRAEVATPGVQTLTWDEAIPELVAMARMKARSTDILMLVLTVIVMLGVLNTLLMSVLERTRELGVLLAVGMRPRRLAQMVVLEGLVLGVLASAVALLWSIPLSLYLERNGIDYTAFIGETLDAGGVTIEAVFYAAMNPSRVIAYTVGTILFTALAALYPAMWVARLEPVDAMRAT